MAEARRKLGCRVEAVMPSADARGLLRPASLPALPPLRSTRVLDQLRERIGLLHYSRRTEQAYVHWVRAFIRFHGIRHPAQMGASEVQSILSWLAVDRKLEASSHRQELAALRLLYSKVMGQQLPWMSEIGRPRVTRRVPVVLSREEVAAVFEALDGEHRLFAQLLYGTGLRLAEGLQLRVKDL